MKMVIAVCALFAVLVLSSPPASTQTAQVSAPSISDSDIQLSRSNLQAEKKNIIQHTMEFTDADAKAFWPIYDDFARERQKLGDQLLQVIDDYADHFVSMDDAKAKELTQRMLNLEAANVNLRQNYFSSFAKALGPKRAAKFYQVDSRLSLLVNAQLMDVIPLVR
jgi:hypothetical protein